MALKVLRQIGPDQSSMDAERYGSRDPCSALVSTSGATATSSAASAICDGQDWSATTRSRPITRVPSPALTRKRKRGAAAGEVAGADYSSTEARNDISS